MNNDELLIALQDMFEKKVEEVKRHTGILVEDLRGDVKAVAEGHSFLDRKIDNLQKDLSETKQELKQEMHSLRQETHSLRQETHSLRQETHGLRQEMHSLKQEVYSLKQDMTIVKDYVIGVDEKLNEHETILKRAK